MIVMRLQPHRNPRSQDGENIENTPGEPAENTPIQPDSILLSLLNDPRPSDPCPTGTTLS